jgi:hypothetical protein
MELTVNVLGALLTTAVLWLGFKKLKLSSPVNAALWFLELGALLGSVLFLGWFGWVIFLVANALGVLAWSVYLAAQKERTLTYAATQAGTTKEEMQDLHQYLMTEHEAFMAMDPITVAQLISQLSQRNRSVEEIKQMALPIALLWVVHRPELNSFVERYDRLLRLHGEPASRAMAVADTLTQATQHSAATFEEMLDAMIAVKS